MDNGGNIDPNGRPNTSTGSDWVSSGFGVQSGGIGRGMAVGVVRVNDTVRYISPRLFGLFEVIVGASTTKPFARFLVRGRGPRS
ncbi:MULTISPECIES: hypothetical protein [Pigmentiphaga]|jgi:hypothetical protein|uniref:Uncharacterized protein n=1 Tax=Pigmentiphaga daeguensis TaxID=414049 RepID=A0ABN1BYA3_9BURK|nr:MULTISPECIES: hypothetical protein [unclassified Pigmentiphaga]